MASELEHTFLDPNIPRKGTVIKRHLEGIPERLMEVPMFSLVEFNLSGLCNRTCVFCPRVDPNIFPNVNEHLPVALYEKIMAELAEVQDDRDSALDFLDKAINQFLGLMFKYQPFSHMNRHRSQLRPYRLHR